MQNNSRCDLVVAICTYNNAHLLDQTLETLAVQQVASSVHWSVLVVDNNCTDDTEVVVKGHIQRGQIPGLRIVRETEQGLSCARRRAVQESVAPWIAFVDDDCLLEPDWIQQAFVFCQMHPCAGAIGGQVHLLWETPPEPLVLQYARYLAYQDHGDEPCQMPTAGITYLVGAGLILQRAALEKSGWLERGILVDRKGKQLSTGGDVEIVLRIRRAGYELWYHPELKLQHYIPVQRISTEYIARLERANAQILPALNLLSKEQKADFKTCFGGIAKSTVLLLRALASTIWRDLIPKQQLSPERRISLSRAVGNVQGHIWLLLSGGLLDD